MLSSAKRKIYMRKIKEFWIDFSHNRVGFAGLVILMVFVVMAVAAPVLAPENPIHQKKVAAAYAVPKWWVIIDPSYKNKPPTIHYPFNTGFSIAPENSSCTNIQITHPPDGYFQINYEYDGRPLNQTHLYIIEYKFNYTYEEPPDWTLQGNWKAYFQGLNYRMEIYFKSANGSEWIMWGQDYDVVTKRIKVLPQKWNIKEGSFLVGAKSTYLKRILYYEKYYEIAYEKYLELYPYANITFPKEFVAFTYEGFRNFTSRMYLIDVETGKEIPNPIYSEYLNLNRTGQVNMTWTEYWKEWINSTTAEFLWESIRDYVESKWLEFEAAFSNASEYVKIGNETYSNVLYRSWVKNMTFRRTGYTWQVLPWNEIVYIFNMTDSEELANYTSIDLSGIYGEKYRLDISNATDKNPAYQRWKQLWNGTLPWEVYWQFWEEIQVYRGKIQFINQYLKTVRLGPERIIAEAQKEAYELSSVGPTPTYFLSHPGTQTIRFYIYVRPKTEDARLELKFFARETVPCEFTVWGAKYGILGADSFGRDVWVQLVHGARISLIVGSLAAVLSTTLGIFFGVLSGYVGGLVDEITMRIVDILLCLPVLPLLLALSAYFKPNVYYLVIIIAIFGWQGLSRTIRSRVLSLREQPFIESARAAGASSSYLLVRHLIPNVFPIAMASLVLSVPAAILTEAALSYLGFGDPFAPTWGKMLHEAQDQGAFHRFAWWYILPPGIAITLLCLAFVFIGHALDEIVNPRLRRRR